MPDAVLRGWPDHELREATREGRFEDEGWRVRKDGSRFWANIALMDDFRPDTVLLDLGLPGMSGYEVARHLRGRRETAHALIIALTGYGQPEDTFRIKTAGFDHHLVKPAVPEQLAALVGQNASD
jgi:CheY-like chemotaxis protein